MQPVTTNQVSFKIVDPNCKDIPNMIVDGKKITSKGIVSIFYSPKLVGQCSFTLRFPYILDWIYFGVIDNKNIEIERGKKVEKENGKI